MSTSTQTLAFNIVGRDVSGARTLSSLGREAETAGGKFGALGSQMATFAKAGALAGIAGIGVALKTGFGEVKDYQAGLAQLQAGIKSTGGAAGLTAGEMESLASNIQNYSGQTDDSIVKSESLLQTFTNIRDVAGENNDIFTRATKATADMAAKFGGDASSQAIKLGKALNDPVKGLTALTKIGVSFTEQQSEQVKAMVAAGNTLGAQKVILAELSKETGGAAAAFGKTLPGQIERTKRAFEDASQELVTALLPVINKVVQVVRDDLIPAFSATVHFIQENQAWLKPLAETVAVIVAGWKAYTVWTKAASAANVLLGRSAAAAAVELNAEAAAGAKAAAASKGIGPGGGLGVAGMALTAVAIGGKALSDSIESKQDAAMREHLITLAKTADGLRQVQAGEKATAAAVDKGAFSFGGLNVRMHDNYKAAADSASATTKDAAAHGEAAAAAHKQAQAISALTDKMAKHTAAILASEGSYDGFRQLLNDLPSVVKENGRALRGYSDGAIANRGALRQLAGSIQEHIANLKEQGKSTGTQNRALLEMEKRLKRTAEATFGSKQAADQWLRKIGMLPSQTRNALDNLGEQGTQAGKDFGQGLAFGLDSMIGTIRTAALNAAAAVVAATRGKDGLDEHSPSKKGEKAGEDWVAGIAQGIKHGEAVLRHAAHMLADALATGFNYSQGQILGKLSGRLQDLISRVQETIDTARQGIRDTMQEGISAVRDDLREALSDIGSALSDVIGKIDERLGNRLERINDGLKSTLEAIQATVDTARSKLDELTAAAASMASSIASSLGALNLSSLFSQDETGATVMGNVGTFLAGKLASLQRLAEDIKSLRAAGLSGPLLSDIVSLPVDQATMAAEQILSGAAGSIGDLNAAQSSIDSVAGDIGAGVAGQNFNGQIFAATVQLLDVEQKAASDTAAAQSKAEADRATAIAEARADRQEARQQAREDREAARRDADRQIEAIREEAQKDRNVLVRLIGALADLPKDANAKEIRDALLKLKNQIGALGLA